MCGCDEQRDEMNGNCFKGRSSCYDMHRLPCSVINQTVHTDGVLLATDMLQPFPGMMYRLLRYDRFRKLLALHVFQV